MNILTLDIETLPDQTPGALEKFVEQEPVIDGDKYTIDQLCVDLNKTRHPSVKYKKPELVAEWNETLGEQKRIEKATEKFKKTSFDGAHGQVLMIGMAFNDEAPVINYEGDEITTLKTFNERIADLLSENRLHTVGIDLVGHNIIDFDLKFLYHRYVINKITPVIDFANLQKQQIFDTMKKWQGWSKADYISLDNLCTALGIPTPKGNIDGSQVYEYWLEGRDKELVEYCLGDVSATREVYKRMNFID